MLLIRQYLRSMWIDETKFWIVQKWHDFCLGRPLDFSAGIVRDYCFTGTMPYSYRMTSRVLFSAQYYRQHCTLQAFKQFICMLMIHSESQQTQSICIPFVQCWTNVEDVGLTLDKCCTHVFCLLGYYLPLCYRNGTCRLCIFSLCTPPCHWSTSYFAQAFDQEGGQWAFRF